MRRTWVGGMEKVKTCIESLSGLEQEQIYTQLILRLNATTGFHRHFDASKNPAEYGNGLLPKHLIQHRCEYLGNLCTSLCKYKFIFYNKHYYYNKITTESKNNENNNYENNNTQNNNTQSNNNTQNYSIERMYLYFCKDHAREIFYDKHSLACIFNEINSHRFHINEEKYEITPQKVICKTQNVELANWIADKPRIQILVGDEHNLETLETKDVENNSDNFWDFNKALSFNQGDFIVTLGYRLSQMANYRHYHLQDFDFHEIMSYFKFAHNQVVVARIQLKIEELE